MFSGAWVKSQTSGGRQTLLCLLSHCSIAGGSRSSSGRDGVTGVLGERVVPARWPPARQALCNSEGKGVSCQRCTPFRSLNVNL